MITLPINRSHSLNRIYLKGMSQSVNGFGCPYGVFAPPTFATVVLLFPGFLVYAEKVI